VVVLVLPQVVQQVLEVELLDKVMVEEMAVAVVIHI